MKKYKILPILMMLALPASAAASGTQWTLDSCMRYAAAHALSVRQSIVEADKAREGVGEAAAGFIPVVSGSVSGQVSWGRNVDPETNTYNTVNTFNNYYDLTARMTLFDGGRTFNAFRRARTLLQQSRNATVMKREEKAVEVMQKYADAVYYRQCTSLAAMRLADSRRLLEKTRRMKELGMKSLPDVAQIEAQVAADDYNLTRQRNLTVTALLALKSAMNYPADSTLELSVTTGDSSLPGREDAEAIYASALTTNSRAADADYRLKLATLDYKVAMGKALPALSIAGTIATSYYKMLQGGGSSSSFASQFRNNSGEYVYATLSVPLFDWSIYKGIRKARNDVSLASLQRAETLRQLHDDIALAVADREGCFMEQRSLEGKVGADSIAYCLSVRKYEEGMLSTTDLRKAADDLFEARTNLLQKQLLLMIKQRLVDYYKGQSLIKQ